MGSWSSQLKESLFRLREVTWLEGKMKAKRFPGLSKPQTLDTYDDVLCVYYSLLQLRTIDVFLSTYDHRSG